MMQPLTDMNDDPAGALLEPDDRLVRLRDTVRAQLPAEIAVAVIDPRVPQTALFADEQTAVDRAVPARVQEFAAGRATARSALADLGQKALPIPKGPGGMPVWPRGVSGSISHCDTACVAIAGRDTALGIDIEPATPLDPALADIVCRDAELAWLNRSRMPHHHLMGKLIFSAKECVYKCQYPLTRHFMDFHALQLEISPQTRVFSAVFQQPNPVFEQGARIDGRFAISDGLIVTTAWLRHADLPAKAGGDGK